MAVSKSLRFEVLRRDGFKCRYCGLKASETELQVDHVKPVTLGGADEASNLVAACFDCNAGKGKTSPDAPLVANVDADALRWAEAMKEAARRINENTLDVAGFLDRFDEKWLDWHYGDDKDNNIPRPNDWRESIKMMRAAGLDGQGFVDAIHIAMSSRASADGTWKYFCGVCWRKISEMQAVAQALVGEQETAA
jgi:DNA-directed RNA polymerase subunit RPC12/RpoP